MYLKNTTNGKRKNKLTFRLDQLLNVKSGPLLTFFNFQLQLSQSSQTIKLWFNNFDLGCQRFIGKCGFSNPNQVSTTAIIMSNALKLSKLSMACVQNETK